MPTATVKGFQGQYRFLSNFYPVEVIFDQLIYPTVEHAYQASKTLNRHERAEITTLPTPGQAKRRGRLIQLRGDWSDELRLGIMHNLLHQKFRADPLQRQLLDTGLMLLVEVNQWDDRFWGMYNGQGHNHLGRLLMKIREEYRHG